MKILITGTSSGLGNYLTLKLKNNHQVTGISRTDNIINDINFIKGDLTKDTFLKSIEKQIDTIDYLILNAGIGYFDNFEKINFKNHKKIINLNLTANILLSYLLIKKINIGIIFIGSIAGKKSMKYGASYAASKFGLRGFAMQLKNEFPKLNISIINPSIIKNTNLHKNSKIDIIGKYKQNSLENIYSIVENIINGKEKRFEIDL